MLLSIVEHTSSLVYQNPEGLFNDFVILQIVYLYIV